MESVIDGTLPIHLFKKPSKDLARREISKVLEYICSQKTYWTFVLQ